MKTVEIMMVVHDRIEYTMEAVERLLLNDFPFKLKITDNCSTDPLIRKYLMSITDPRVTVEYWPVNTGITFQTNRFWKESKAEVLGKIDNDIAVPEDAIARLYEYMELPEPCVISGFHFEASNVNGRPIDEFHGKQVYSPSLIGGALYLFPRVIYEKCGPIPVGSENTIVFGWQAYQNIVRAKGYKILYACPIVKVEHMPDRRDLDIERKYKDYYYRIHLSRTTQKNIKPDAEITTPDEWDRFGRT